MAKKIIKNDKGTIILLDAGTSLISQNSLVIKYKKPSGVTGTWDSDVVSVYNSDFARFTTASDTLDEAGVWDLKIYTELLSGWKGHGEVVGMKVYDEWES